MKKVALFLVAAVAISSCSLFQKPSMTQEQIDALVNSKASVQEELVNLQQQYDLLKIQADECAALLEEQTAVVVPTGNYFVIAGSFKNMSYANDYSAKVQNMGGSGEIIDGPYNFNLVVYSSHETLRDAADNMYMARTNVSDDAWVYKGK